MTNIIYKKKIILFKKHTNMSPENYRIKYFNIDPDSNKSVKN